jgi:hypothetical protein
MPALETLLYEGTYAVAANAANAAAADDDDNDDVDDENDEEEEEEEEDAAADQGHPLLELAGPEPVIAALKVVEAFQCLKTLSFNKLRLEVPKWDELLGALAGAPCAGQLMGLFLQHSNFFPASMATLSQLLGQNGFPMLERLSFGGTSGIGDDGAAVLAQGLLAASRTRLTGLKLAKVGISDEGVAAVASLVRAGCLERLQEIFLGANSAFTDQGVGVLTRAIQAAGKNGLPRLLEFWGKELPQVTRVGIVVLVSVLIRNCPRLKLLNMRGNKEKAGSHNAVVEGMVLAAGCKYRLEVKV